MIGSRNVRPRAQQAELVAFYDLIFNQGPPREAIEQYAGAHYTQHKPGVADGKEGFIACFEEAAREYPGKRVEFIRVIAEGNLVVLHCRQDWPGDHGWAGIASSGSIKMAKSWSTGTCRRSFPTRVRTRTTLKFKKGLGIKKGKYPAPDDEAAN